MLHCLSISVNRAVYRPPLILASCVTAAPLVRVIGIPMIHRGLADKSHLTPKAAQSQRPEKLILASLLLCPGSASANRHRPLRGQLRHRRPHPSVRHAHLILSVLAITSTVTCTSASAWEITRSVVISISSMIAGIAWGMSP